MNSLRFKILITLLSLHADFAFELTDINKLMEAIRSSKDQDDNSIEKYTNNTIIIVVTQPDYEESSSSYENTGNLMNKYLSDEMSSGDNVTHSRDDRILRSHSDTTSETPSTKRSIQQVTTRPPGISALSEAKQKAHERRIREVSEHMAQHFMSTQYFYNEVKRIQKQHVVMDELRIMAVEFEHPNNRWMRDEMLKCFRVHSRPVTRPVWNKKTNNLVINILQNSINDGVVI